MNHIKRIENEIKELRNKLTSHRLYNQLSSMKDIQKFMEKHVYAVWDFMSLLKALQNHLTCMSIPWTPVKNSKTARFINEIVLCEESDFNENGVPRSHFEMYIDAMREVDADTSKIFDLIESVNTSEDILYSLLIYNLKKAEKEFLTFTFKIIQTNQIHKIAAAFTFGREDLIPDMFIEIIDRSNKENENSFPKLSYYLNRHIEIDGDEHGPLSLEMISELCGNDEQKWKDVQDVSVEALKRRVHLWDEIADEIKENKSASNLICQTVS